MNLRPLRRCLFVLGCLLPLTLVSLAGAATPDIPEALIPWEAWVRHGQAEQVCPPRYNDAESRRCWWPSRLTLEVGEQGGLFDMQVTVYAPAWVALPGADGRWPESVIVDGRAVAVTAREGIPVCRLDPGNYRVGGAFVWEGLPEWLQVPVSVGLLTLKIDGREIAAPDLEPDGRLRLYGKKPPQRREDTLTATLFRLIEDDIPMRVTTRLLLQVAGRPRELRLPGLLPEGGVAMAVDSPLPAQLDDSGTLIVQGKPGTWDIRVTARLTGPVDTLGTGNDRYGEEIWSFRADNALRMVNVSGAPTVEPSRTRMPDAWKRYPAYLLKPGERLTFETIRRGDPDPAPDRLSLRRTWWLDFNGAGFTIHDRIDGILHRSWHLAMVPPGKLGRVSVDGRDRLITRQGTNGDAGVQLRQGRLSLEADSRLMRAGTVLPAVGWDHDFQQVGGELNLPPGWTLFSATGVDVPPGAWLQRWTLLDFFLVLIIAVAAWKVRGRATGLLALVTLVLIFHEPGAPRLVWLQLLAVIALLKYLPDGWFRKLVMVWGAGAVIALVVIALPFMIQQVRGAIYPQLAIPGGVMPPRPAPLVSTMTLDEKGAARPETLRMQKKMPTALSNTMVPPIGGRRVQATAEADALIQTGPGLPDWHWRSVRLRWNGPVARTQTIRLWLVSPAMNLGLGLIRPLLLLLMIAAFLDLRHWRRCLPAPPSAASVAVVLMLVLLAPVKVFSAPAETSAFPPQQLLDELRQRLFEPPVCLPRCADVSHLELAATPDQIRVILTVNGQADTAIPLPVTGDSWRPARLLLDNDPIPSLARDDRANLWMVLPKGVHEVKMIGPAGNADEIRFTFPIVPHTGTYAGVGWQASGFRTDGGVAATIALRRIKKDEVSENALKKADIQPFFHVTRTLSLGLEWEATTRLQRVTAPGAAAVLSVPLLAGASLITPGISVSDGMARIAMGPEEKEIAWTTTLPIAPEIALTAPTDVPWTETWVLDAGTMWRCDASGLTPIHHQDAADNWQPRWRPWPGERVTIAITRPAAIPGRSATIDSARMTFTPGQRFSRAELTLAIRTSKGARRQIELPPKANLQAVTINGSSLPVRQDGRLVTIPLEPGAQTVRVEWRQLTSIGTLIKGPRVNLGDAAVNATVSIRMPDHRWILWAGGPRLGPAVLFWSYLLVVLVIAAALGRIRLTPLGTAGWILLGLGLTQVAAPVAVLVAGWLLALEFRCRRRSTSPTAVFNAGQVLLVLLTLAALTGLYTAIQHGLLGIPDMQVAGNGSTRLQLNWTQDRIAGGMPVPWVLSLPQWVYHLLMLFWSLWLAFSLIRWLRWGWGCFAAPRMWQPIHWRRRRKKAAATPAEAAPNEPGGE